VRRVARKKDQTVRRQQLVQATIDLIADRGIEALTHAAIADRVGISHRLVAYYYAQLDSLVLEAHQVAAERYYWERLRALDESAAPERRMVQLIRSGFPGQRDRRLSQVLNELSVSASRSELHARLMTELFEREVSLYLSVLRDGAASGAFRLSEPELTVARNLVALEDAYGFHLLAKTSSVDAGSALDALVGYAATVTGADLPRAGLPRAGLPRAGLPRAGLPRAGLPRAGLPRAGLPRAGLPSAGLPSAGLPSAGLLGPA
jgi:DNA-binding transcriptional regulator YbjK